MTQLIAAFFADPGIYFGYPFRITGLPIPVAWTTGTILVLILGAYHIGTKYERKRMDPDIVALQGLILVVTALVVPIFYFAFLIAAPVFIIAVAPFKYGRRVGRQRRIVADIAERMSRAA